MGHNFVFMSLQKTYNMLTRIFQDSQEFIKTRFLFLNYSLT